MGTDWDSARNTDPYYISAAEEQKIIDEELEMTSATPKPRAGEHVPSNTPETDALCSRSSY